MTNCYRAEKKMREKKTIFVSQIFLSRRVRTCDDGRTTSVIQNYTGNGNLLPGCEKGKSLILTLVIADTNP